MGIIFGTCIGIALIGMFGLQLYRIATDESAEQTLLRGKRQGHPQQQLQDYSGWEAAFGRDKWTWLLPTRPRNEQHDPHLAAAEEIALPDYEVLTSND